MKQQRIKKKAMAFLVAVAMTATSLPAFGSEVHAAELPDSTQFATKDDLMEFDTNDRDGVNPAKVLFGKDSQKWWIAGSQHNDSATLFAAAPLGADQVFTSDFGDKSYKADWGCDYTSAGSSAPGQVNRNHYGGSKLRTEALKKLESSYFTKSEQGLMKATTIYTRDSKNNNVYSTTDKLYLAYGEELGGYVTAGTNSPERLNNGLRIDNTYWENRRFWLRTPGTDGDALCVNWGFVQSSSAAMSYSLIPAFELDLSSVLFASAAPAASDGQLKMGDAFTLRYQPDDAIGTARISRSKQNVTVTGIKNKNTYLVVQSKDGAWAKRVSDNDSVSAGEMSSTLTSFENCKVWLETTGSSQRMTYAALATEATGYDVKVDLGDHMTVSEGNAVQTDVTGSIEDIVIKAEDGYMFPADYTVAEQNGITVKRDNENQLTISGAPTADVSIALLPAAQKVFGMTLSGNGTFTKACEGYIPVAANEFTIKNTGNVALENVNVSITGDDADRFELGWDNTSTINSGGTLKVTVKPSDDLAVGTYQAGLSVSADNAAGQSIDLQFTVSEHDYNTVVTPPTCILNGYTTYTCKNCSYSYEGNAVQAKGHTWGAWEITDSPTCEQGGIRVRTCQVCGSKETGNLDPNGHEWNDDYTVDKEPTCTTDGSKSIHCKNCDAVKGSEVISKLGHSFTQYVSDGNATCTEDGTRTASCDNGCGETYTINDSGSMLPHDYEWTYNDDAACEKNGTETGICRSCHTEMKREKTDSALGHEFQNYVSDRNATCTENGTETAKCERCDKTDTRTMEDSALGHQFGEWKVTKKATETTDGEKIRNCERCDYKESQVVKATGTNPNNSNENKPNTDKNNVKTGDQTNLGLYVSLLSVSVILIAVLAAARKKKAFERK